MTTKTKINISSPVLGNKIRSLRQRLFARLADPAEGRQFDAFLVRMPPGQEHSEVTTHAGEEFFTRDRRSDIFDARGQDIRIARWI